MTDKITIPPPPDDVLRCGIARLGISVRTYKALRKAGIVDVGQIEQLGKSMARLPNVGRITMDELKREIRRQNPWNRNWPE